MSETYDASQLLSTSAAIADLLQTPSREQQLAWLRGRGLLTEDGVKQLLSLAAKNMGGDMQTAGALADVCVAAAQDQHWAALAGQAAYLRAQVHAIHAEFELALRQIEAARNHFLDAGDDVAALRTDVGWMGVMREVGRCQEAIASGLKSLHQIDAQIGEQSLIAARMRNNLGVCYEQLGQFDEAMQYWAAAEAAFRSNDAVEEACHAQNNRGVIYLKQGQAHSALRELDAAARVFADNNLVLNLAQARINMSQAYFMLGDPGHGLSCLEEAQRLIEPLGASAENLVLLLDTAEAYNALNLQSEALQLYERVVPEMQLAGMSDERMRALLGMSSALIAQGQSNGAVALLNELGSTLQNATATPIGCRLMLNRALALSSIGNENIATQQALLALQQAAAHGWQRQLAEACLLFAELPSTKPATAIIHLEQARQIAQQIEWPELRTQVQQRLGHIYLRNGREAEAESLLIGAIADVEQSRATLTEDRYRVAFLKNKTDAFNDLVQLYLQRSQRASQSSNQQAALQTAFAFAERAKSRALLDMMADDGVLPGVSNISEGQSPTNTSSTLHLDEVRTQMDAGSVFLYYYVCGDDISAFVISKHHEKIECALSISQLATVTPLLDALAVQWERFLAGPDFVTRYGQQIEAATQRVLFQLYQALVAPVEPLIRTRTVNEGAINGDTPLIIVAHGLLHQVPFHALHDGTDYLIERYEISYAPSATIYLLSQQRKPQELGKALVVGADDDSIPMALVEAQQVAHQLAETHPQLQLRIGAQATLQQVQADIANCDIVHLACHGLFRHDNPLFSSLQLHDGRLTAADVVRLKFNGALVTLGACESGRSEVIAGDEMLGLPRAFLGAGASSVLVSLWLVHDETTAEFMQSWYAHIQQGQPRAQALRAVQRAIKSQRSHPYYWAPFVLMGQR